MDFGYGFEGDLGLSYEGCGYGGQHRRSGGSGYGFGLPSSGAGHGYGATGSSFLHRALEKLILI